MVPLNYAVASSVGFYSGADTLDLTDNDVISAARFYWKQIYAAITISRLDELKNSGDAAKVNFVKSKVEIAEKSLKEIMGDAVFNAGTDAKALLGIRSFIDTTKTYGGIDQSANSWWAAQVDSATATLTIPALQAKFGDATFGSEHPTIIISDQDKYDLYYALLQPQQRFMDSDSAKGGFQSLIFNGIVWMVDQKSPSNHIFMLNEDYIDLYVHKDENMRMMPFESPLNQNIKVAKIFWMGELCSSNNRVHAKLSAITA